MLFSPSTEQSGFGLVIQPLTWEVPAAGVANKSENVKAAMLPIKNAVCVLSERQRERDKDREEEGIACSN